MNSNVIEDGVAIHFSMASIRGAWITDGKIVDHVISAQRTSEAFGELMNRRDQWVRELENRGIQFRFLATPQIEAGELSRYRVLILPYSIALSDVEIEEIERFAAGGGLVYLDEQTARMDDRLHWRKKRPWTQERRNFLRTGPQSLELSRAIGIEGDFLTSIRRFGSGRICALLPKTKTTVQLPASDAVRYDLLSGRLAQSKMVLSPEEPLLLFERERPIATIKITDDLSIFVEDDQGQPVDRSVVTVTVHDPSGGRLRHYSKNIDIRQGKGRFSIPFAINDPKGDWRIVARDVISGLQTEAIVTRN
jgi:hypothetical protein